MTLVPDLAIQRGLFWDWKFYLTAVESESARLDRGSSTFQFHFGRLKMTQMIFHRSNQPIFSCTRQTLPGADSPRIVGFNPIHRLRMGGRS
jgi:hypothetical protein